MATFDSYYGNKKIVQELCENIEMIRFSSVFNIPKAILLHGPSGEPFARLSPSSAKIPILIQWGLSQLGKYDQIKILDSQSC